MTLFWITVHLKEAWLGPLEIKSQQATKEYIMKFNYKALLVSSILLFSTQLLPAKNYSSEEVKAKLVEVLHNHHDLEDLYLEDLCEDLQKHGWENLAKWLHQMSDEYITLLQEHMKDLAECSTIEHRNTVVKQIGTKLQNSGAACAKKIGYLFALNLRKLLGQIIELINTQKRNNIKHETNSDTQLILTLHKILIARRDHQEALMLKTENVMEKFYTLA